MSINRVNISGFLTRDPDLRATASGMPVLSFSVAVNDRRRNQQTGEWEDYPNFIDCTMLGVRAESVSRFLSKGSKVAIEGKLRWSQWERADQKRSKIEVLVDEIEFMSRSEQPQYAQPAQPVAQPAYAPQPVAQPMQQSPQPVQPQMIEVPPAPAPSVYDEDIPF